MLTDKIKEIKVTDQNVKNLNKLLEQVKLEIDKPNKLSFLNHTGHQPQNGGTKRRRLRRKLTKRSKSRRKTQRKRTKRRRILRRR